ncbi:MAG: DNA repair protein RadA [Syntrophomonadaceae bacterium]|nr:DNA repair protein RadA [Syntrophomonadaceae bacterium]
MAKITTRFVCYECGYESPKWMGKCPSCSEWNTLVEEVDDKRSRVPAASRVSPITLDSIGDEDVYRYSSGIGELDRVLGGGMVPGSVVLLGGDPGIGKSTLLLQVAAAMASSGARVLYLSGEESLKQIRLRSLRLGINSSNIFLLNEQDINQLDDYVDEIKPAMVIIDSIQTVYTPDITSLPGSVAQLRESTARIMNIAKKRDIPFFLVGHVTKEGALAGPKVLEHMVDVVIYFEGEKNFSFRLLRGVKNRFGSTDEIGLMEMSGQGLVEVVDPSYVFLTSSSKDCHGTAIAASFEGSRPLLIEIQALVAPNGPAYGRRMASGIDGNRLALIIAVLEKRRAFNLASCDVYLKVTGGVFLKDPSVDLAIAAAIVSSYREQVLPLDTVFAGELSLSGQIRSVPFLEQRLKEVERMGYKRVIIPAGTGRKNYGGGLEMIEVASIDDLIENL